MSLGFIHSRAPGSFHKDLKRKVADVTSFPGRWALDGISLRKAVVIACWSHVSVEAKVHKTEGS